MAGAYRSGEEVCVLAANSSVEPLGATLTMPGADGRVDVMFEDRRVAAVGFAVRRSGVPTPDAAMSFRGADARAP